MQQTTVRWASALLMATTAGGAGSALAQVTPTTETQITSRYIIDFEFDSARDGVNCPTCNNGAGNSRIAYTDLTYRLWVGNVDFRTGAFKPSDGRGVLVDSYSSLPTDFGNGPEWMFSALGSQLVYTRYTPDLPFAPENAGIALATQGTNGTWSAAMYDNGLGRQSPLGSQDLADPVPRLQYQDMAKTKTWWRSSELGAPEGNVPMKGYNAGSRRWVPGTHKIILTGNGDRKRGITYRQVFLYDTDTGTSEQLTDDTANHSGGMMWQAPEYNNEYVFFSVRNSGQIVVWRKLIDPQGVPRWTQIGSVTAPADYPYVWSPEYFVYNGKSYIFFQLNQSPNSSDLTKPSKLAITGILPENTALVSLTPADAPARIRMDPEYFITAQGPLIYYNRYKVAPEGQAGAQPEGVWAVNPGLAPPPSTRPRTQKVSQKASTAPR